MNHITLKYKLLPNKEQLFLIEKTFGCVRKLYNCYVNWDGENYLNFKNGGESEKLPLVTFFKNQEELSYLKEVDDYALMNERKHFLVAKNEFIKSLKGTRKGKEMGKPKIKKKGKCRDSYTTSFSHNNIRFDGDKIRLPKLGFVKFIEHREYSQYEKLISVTVTKEKDGLYYISVVFEIPDEQYYLKTKNNIENISDLKVVGLDMSMSDFVVSSEPADNMKSKYVRNYRLEEKKLKQLQRRVSKKQKGSKNKEKARKKLGKLSIKVSNRRKDYCHKLSKYYVSNYDVIVIEDINLQNMAKSLHLGKSVNDLGFGFFKQCLNYKSERYDSLVYKVDKWFASSKLCSCCGCKNTDLKLSDREWTCSNCDAHHDRDLNAAQNLKNNFLKEINMAGTTKLQACGDNTSGLRETLIKVLSVKQEAPSFREG